MAAGFRRGLRTRWHLFRAALAALWASPAAIRIPAVTMLIVLVWLGANWAYHAAQKPTEVFFPLDNSLDKSPRETWRQYGPLFREHATSSVTPELLAALAQVEGGGNPVARTYWRWRSTWNPFEWYRPASSAVGMYQMTDGTFRAAKRYCVHNHAVVEDGPWHDLESCWFNSLYTRVLPSHSIELTAASLDRDIASALGVRRGAAGVRQKQDLAALIHLCGAGAGRDFAARGFRLTPHQKCGDHDVAAYLGQVRGLTQQFTRLAAGAGGEPTLIRAR
ncbi:MAG: transglycosylase SLT domain-containing protein [Nitrospiraceae bacterium]